MKKIVYNWHNMLIKLWFSVCHIYIQYVVSEQSK